MIVFAGIVFAGLLTPVAAKAEGEPAENFVNLLRASKYFDVAITYLDRLDDFPRRRPGF